MPEMPPDSSLSEAQQADDADLDKPAEPATLPQPATQVEVPDLKSMDPEAAFSWLENLAAKQGAPPEEQLVSPQPMSIQPVFLTRHGRTNISILMTNTPWELDVDALVIPVGVRAGLGGGLAGGWLTRLGLSVSDQFRSAVQQALSDRKAP